MRYRTLLLAGLALISITACTPAQPAESAGAAANPFVGAWIITETSVTNANGTRVNENPEPGLYMFTQHHFSNMLIPGATRTPFSAARTDEERLAAYDNFFADAGTYEYTESTLTATNMIAKMPHVMPPHATGPLTYQWRLDGDALIMTLRGGWAPRGGEITYRLARLE